MKDYIEQTINRIEKGELKSFQQWCDELNDDQITKMSDGVDRGEEPTMTMVVTLAVFFAKLETGREEFSEEEAIKYAHNLSATMAILHSVRAGHMVQRGSLTVTDGSTSTLKVTESGKQHARDLIKELGDE